ncbi:MAG TPA: ThuA domain-containing protein, partial [Chitinophagaceae bacterium]|nr:ThuA domain-containing protein [Chitinophagaceae bacterium]
MYKSFIAILLAVAGITVLHTRAQKGSSKFKVIAFYTERNDLAHISFVHEANKWFPKMAAQNNFVYDSTNDWTKLNT